MTTDLMARLRAIEIPDTTEQNEYQIVPKNQAISEQTDLMARLRAIEIEPKEESTLSKVGSFIGKTGEEAQRKAGIFFANALPWSNPAFAAYNLAAMASKAIGSSKPMYQANMRESIRGELNMLLDQKAAGQWSEEDAKRYDHMVDLLKNPDKMDKYRPKDEDISGFDLHSMLETGLKASGFDPTPRDTLETAIGWLGFIKNPAKAQSLMQGEFNPKKAISMIKAFMPTAKEAFRSVGAATALTAAAQAEFGPFGTILMAGLGDLLGGGVKGIAKAAMSPIQTTKAIASKVAALPARLAMKAEQLQLQQQLIKSLRESGIQADVGTISGSNLIKQLQSMLSQSGLVGQDLELLRNEMINSITDQYKNLAENLGDARFRNYADAGEALKGVAKVEQAAVDNLNAQRGELGEKYRLTQAQAKGLEPSEYEPRSLKGRIDVMPEKTPEVKPSLEVAQKETLSKIADKEFANSRVATEQVRAEVAAIEKPIKADFKEKFDELGENLSTINTGPQPELVKSLNEVMEQRSFSLLPRNIENRIMNSINRLLSIFGSNVGYTEANLKDLWLTKRSLSEIPNWQISNAGVTGIYKKLTGDVDAAIKRTLTNTNPELLEEYTDLNASYSAFKDTFENKLVEPLVAKKNISPFKTFEHILGPDALMAAEKILEQSPKGKELVNKLKRSHAKKVFGKTKKPIDETDLNNLKAVLGPEYEGVLSEYTSAQEAISEFAPETIDKTTLKRPVMPVEAAEVPTPKFNAWIPEGLNDRVTVSKAKTMNKVFADLVHADPEKISSKMNSVSGIRELRQALSTSNEGRDLYSQLVRFKVDDMFNKNFAEGTRNQLKMGTFSKILNSKHNQDILKELVGPETFKKFQKLENNTFQIQQSAQKFLNSSQTAISSRDFVALGGWLVSLQPIFNGNPWPVLVSSSVLGSARLATKLLADPEFLKLTEEAMLAPRKGLPAMKTVARKFRERYPILPD